MRITLGIMELQKPSEKNKQNKNKTTTLQEILAGNSVLIKIMHITQNIISFFWVEMAPRYVFIMMCGYENMLIALLRAHN